MKKEEEIFLKKHKKEVKEIFIRFSSLDRPFADIYELNIYNNLRLVAWKICPEFMEEYENDSSEEEEN